VTEIAELWDSTDESRWERALERYWNYVKRSHLALEREIEGLDPAAVQGMDAQCWFDFLLHKYFKWKYTAPNRYASTTMHLKRQASTPGGLDALLAIRNRIFLASDKSVREALGTAGEIKGLGIAGASGLLAVLFPKAFGTVDQFAVKSLRTIPSLPEQPKISRMNPESLTTSEGQAPALGFAAVWHFDVCVPVGFAPRGDPEDDATAVRREPEIGIPRGGGSAAPRHAGACVGPNGGRARMRSSRWCARCFAERSCAAS